ncbi:hypothetical protein SynBIOSU31_01223 [Synechococcus sp. BIOS-U3-1]|nr:hypothetical protein SynBIOSU31_01223 [Synechococcus sp. BIOS-U3-1]
MIACGHLRRSKVIEVVKRSKSQAESDACRGGEGVYDELGPSVDVIKKPPL